MPPGVHLGGLDLSDLKDAAEIRRHLESIYAEPISLHYEARWSHARKISTST